MPNEIYHRSEWGNPKPEGWGDIYFDPAATNKLYNHSDYYENSDGTDKILRDIPNKASITLTPTAYSDGSINTVIPPYQVLPQELVTNGTFDTDSNWTKGTGCSIEGGKAKYTNAPSGQGFTQSNFLTIGKTYKITFNVSDFSLGSVKIRYPFNSSNIITSNGTYTEYGVATSDDLFFQNIGNTTLSIDNVSVKEVQEADFDFSRGSSATRVNEKGLIEDVASGIPRIDYTTGFGSWLLEPQTTNLIPYSEDFSNVAWEYGGDVAIESGYTAPDGSNTAYKVTGTSGALATNVSATSTQTRSIYAKTLSGTGTVQLCTHNSNTNNIFTITPQWQRFEINTTTSLTGVPFFYAVDFRGASTTLSEVVLWGAQLEDLSYATSYIPTSGSTVTRAAETANNSGNADLFNDSEGVLYAEIAALADDQTQRFISISDASEENRVSIRYHSTDLNSINFNLRAANSTVIGSTFILNDITNFSKIAFKYKSIDSAIFIDGFKKTDLLQSFVFDDNLDTLSFDRGDGGNDFYGKTKELAVFKEALTDAELESLTSWISFTEMATDLEYTVE